MPSDKNDGMEANATYSVEKWKEENWNVISPEVKMTKASVEFALTGEMECKATVEYLMFYKSFDSKDPHKSSAKYVGMMKLTGKINGKAGSFAIEDHGTFEAGVALSNLSILEGSGSGELRGIKGSGEYRAGQNGSSFKLNYNF